MDYKWNVFVVKFYGKGLILIRLYLIFNGYKWIVGVKVRINFCKFIF